MGPHLSGVQQHATLKLLFGDLLCVVLICISQEDEQIGCRGLGIRIIHPTTFPLRQPLLPIIPWLPPPPMIRAWQSFTLISSIGPATRRNRRPIE